MIAIDKFRLRPHSGAMDLLVVFKSQSEYIFVKD
jgi:hypothetical protein